MEELDLEAFIANIEETAPQEDVNNLVHRCAECDTVLDDIDGVFVCPNCSTQATNILKYEATEILYDESGRAIVGQRISERKRKSHQIDYGWAWSTDEAIAYVLNLQIKALEKSGLVSGTFRQAIKNMWMKYWIENVAPYIRDTYNENDLIPVDALHNLRHRDIEVLIKVRDRVMLPQRTKRNVRARYTMFGKRFFAKESDEGSDDSLDDNLENKSLNSQTNHNGRARDESVSDLLFNDDDKISATSPILPVCQSVIKPKLVKDTENISILTLNRTLVFIEATARCTTETLSASDLIRACYQRVVPYLGVQKLLPEGMNFNYLDRFSFQPNKLPSPKTLTHSAGRLIYKIYEDRFPIMIPAPDLNRKLEYLITDMNLPRDLLNYMKAEVNFSSFSQTRPRKLYPTGGNVKSLPQYDRWAYAILMCNLKRLFSLNETSIDKQSEEAKKSSASEDGELFILKDWVKQMSIRLKLIMSYDPYVLFHPMANIKNLEPTPQVFNYIEALLKDKATVTTRFSVVREKEEEDYRKELVDFLKQEIPEQFDLRNRMLVDDELEKPNDIRYPILDAFMRTKKYWFTKISQDNEICNILFQNFSRHKVFTTDSIQKWTLYDDADPINIKNHDILPTWPYCFRLLLSVGGYLCYCTPEDLMLTVTRVEEYLYPVMKSIKRRKYCQS